MLGNLSKDELNAVFGLDGTQANSERNLNRLSEMLESKLVIEAEDGECTLIMIADTISYKHNNDLIMIGSRSYAEELENDSELNNKLILLIDKALDELKQ